MKDSHNPTLREIEIWARSNKPEPVQDWDIIIATLDNIYLLIKLASDPDCEKSKYFLKILYFLVGDIIGKKCSPEPEIDLLMKVFDESRAIKNKQIQRWIKLSTKLINHPEEFDYKKWCEGGLVKDIT